MKKRESLENEVEKIKNQISDKRAYICTEYCIDYGAAYKQLADLENKLSILLNELGGVS